MLLIEFDVDKRALLQIQSAKHVWRQGDCETISGSGNRPCHHRLLAKDINTWELYCHDGVMTTFVVDTAY